MRLLVALAIFCSLGFAKAEAIHYFGEVKTLLSHENVLELGKITCRESPPELVEEVIVVEGESTRITTYHYDLGTKAVLVKDANGDVIARGKFTSEGEGVCKIQRLEAKLERFEEHVPLVRVLSSSGKEFFTSEFYEDQQAEPVGRMRGVKIHVSNYNLLRNKLQINGKTPASSSENFQ